MISRLISEDFIPAWPIAMPSVTVIVVNSRGVPRAGGDALLRRLRLARSAMLHGAASFQVVATPMIGWLICSSSAPSNRERRGAAPAPARP